MRVEGTLQRRCPTEGREIWEGAIIVVIVNDDNDDKGTERRVQGRGMRRLLLLSDSLPHWTEDD